jgi:hypothetical protein
MPLKLAKILTSLVVFLMVLEIIGAAIAAIPKESDRGLSVHSKKPAASVFGAFLFEKAEEETEKAEEEKNGADRTVLVDFSWVAHTLSVQFVAKVNPSPFACLYNVRPPVYTINCVFLI